MRSFDTILVANRGEIALRIMRTARQLGYRTVAVYSDADAGAPHCMAADCALRIGGPQPADSYLNIGALLSAARQSGAQAIHPGYGFLAERADFAQACLDAGLVFIGPPPRAIAAMGSKAGARQLMRDAGVPCIPGYDGGDQSDGRLAQEAARIGYPVMVKATAGGGGRGMRRVDHADALPAALAAARSEALHAFGDAGLILEQAFVSPRHIEIQVFADLHGNAVHMGERDCSVQRRHQKLIEETPSPAVDAALRSRMGAVAVAAARAIGYHGAGTLEFLLDAEGQFHFMEMNTRLQVEHAVTEAVLGLDLVEWQLRVAAGEALPLGQAELDARRAAGGHAIEVRLCAEDAHFLPQSGTVLRWQAPQGVRCDHALGDGASVPPYYDSMLAKLVGHGASRAEALRRLQRALDDTVLLGVASNRALLARCLADSEFAAGLATTDFIARRGDALQAPASGARAARVAAALLAMRHGHGHGGAARWPHELHGWSNSAAASRIWRMVLDGARCDVVLRRAGALQRDASDMALRQAGGDCWDAGGRLLQLLAGPDGTWRVVEDGVPAPLAWAAAQDGVVFALDGHDHVAALAPSNAAGKRAAGSSNGRIAAPMNGRVAVLPVAQGSAVKAGQVVAVIEAMKMEHSLLAPCDGVLGSIHVSVGQQAVPGQLLVTVSAP